MRPPLFCALIQAGEGGVSLRAMPVTRAKTPETWPNLSLNPARNGLRSTGKPPFCRMTKGPKMNG